MLLKAVWGLSLCARPFHISVIHIHVNTRVRIRDTNCWPVGAGDGSVSVYQEELLAQWSAHLLCRPCEELHAATAANAQILDNHKNTHAGLMEKWGDGSWIYIWWEEEYWWRKKGKWRWPTRPGKKTGNSSSPLMAPLSCVGWLCSLEHGPHACACLCDTPCSVGLWPSDKGVVASWALPPT